jgi:hypothetical protein
MIDVAMRVAAVRANASSLAREMRREAEGCRQFAKRLSDRGLREALMDVADELNEMAEDIET